MKASILGSSSRGNAILLSSGDSNLLLDSGLNMRKTIINLDMLGTSLDSIDAVLITHCHMDHVRSLPQTGVGKEVISTPGTLHVLKEQFGSVGTKRTSLDYNQKGTVGPFTVKPFPISHDCMGQPCGFVVDDGNDRIAVAMDLGVVTEEVARNLKGCTGLVLESNHDAGMLFNSKRPPWLVNRILGPKGHLSNTECAEALEKVLDGTTDWVVLSHLSQECNNPEKAIEESKNTAMDRGAELIVAHPTLPTRVKEGVKNEKLGQGKEGSPEAVSHMR
ncbi:MAG TPA: MBL fold metallo-hydrolase [Euryarchaeota archaeon]|nr:MBL fold metallo-hydrolase [Euryarchaeota archaeon]